jgi:lipoate-protein ligase A
VTEWRILADDGERDPRLNLARDEALARQVGVDPRAATPVLRLWRSSPCVVVGRSQLVWAEVDLAAAAGLAAPVLRRFTGGGTVWHDEGNLNVSLVVRPDDPRLRDEPARRLVPGVYGLVLEPLASAARALGVATARAEERAVVTQAGKLSGVAAWLGAGAVLVHATLLVDADLDALGRVCAGPGAPGDPRWERTRSRRVPVTSLARELGRLPPGRAVDDAVIAAFVDASPHRAATGTASAGERHRPSVWLPAELTEAERLLRERYDDPGWNGTAVDSA